MNLSEVLATKGATVYSVAPTDSVLDAMALMDAKGVGALIVLRDGGVAGIVSERDVARKITLSGRSAKETPTAEIMSATVTCAAPDLDIRAAMTIMTEERVRHLPVIDPDKKLLGVVSIGDLVKAVIDDQQFTIKQLEQYITS